MGLKLITWLVIYLSDSQNRGSVGILRIVTMSFLAIGLVAAFAMIVLAIQDLIVWLRGGDSVLGKFVGTWEEYKQSVRDTIQAYKDFWAFIKGTWGSAMDWAGQKIDMIIAKLKTLRNTALGMLPSLIPSWAKDVFNAAGRYAGIPGPSPSGDMSRGRSASTVVVNAKADLHLPQGTPEDHVRIVKTAAEEAMNFALGQQMRAAALNLSLGEY